MSTPQPIPQTDPSAGYRAHQAEIDKAIQKVLEGGRYIHGPECAAFERDFAAYLGVPAAVGVGSGTDALYLALRACGVTTGQTVITVSHTAVATVAAVEMCGARPLLVDVDPRTGLMDLNHLEAAAAACVNLAAVIPVHLYGHPVDMPAVQEICRRKGARVIEDCAQSHGAEIAGRKTGAWGDIAAFSFYPTKNLGALGDGGAVVSADPTLVEQVRLLAEYGWKQRYISEISGVNSRLDELQAAVLRVKLAYLDQENGQRRAIAAIYDEILADVSAVRQLNSPNNPGHVYHQYVIAVPQRDALRAWLQTRGIGTLIHYPVPVHQQPAYQGRTALGPGGLGQTERLCGEIVSLPIYPQLAEADARRAAEEVRAFFQP